MTGRIAPARRRIATLAVLVITAGLPLVLSAAPASATVSVGDEAGIRQAFIDETDSTIDLTADIVLDDCSGALLWTTGVDVTINGNGHTLSVSPTCSPLNEHRVIHYRPNIAAARLLTVHNLEVTGGRVNPGSGGGILVENLDITNVASLVLDQGSVIGSTTTTGNFAASSGGGISVADGNTTIDHSTIAGNQTSGSGGGTVSLVGNQTITVNASTISGNDAGLAGGGIAGTNLVITNSTIAGNESGTSSSREGGGVWSLSGTTTVKFSTIVDNTTVVNGAANVELTTPVSASFFGTVVAFPHSTTAGSIDNCQGALTSSGYNFSDVDTCGFGGGTGDMDAGGDPGLDSLASNGGLTRTALPTSASALNKKVPAADCTNALTTDEDQRGVARPTGTLCEIGAVERKAPGVPTSVAASPLNASTSLSFTAPVDIGDSALTGATATCTPTSGPVRTGNAATSPITVSSMANGVVYSCTVHATSSDGDSAESSEANVTPRTVPGAPTGVNATPGNKQMKVTFTPPASTGGSPITSYTVTAAPGGASVTGGGSPLTVTGLTNGVAYTFKAKATNAAGNGLESAPSAAKTSVFQPDVQARKSTTAAFTDLNAYGVASTAAGNVGLGGTATYFVKLFNDGNVTQAINLKALLAGTTKMAVTFKEGAATVFGMTTAGRNYTLAPGASKTITVLVKANAGTAKNATRTVTLTGTSNVQTTKTDQVKVKTTRI